MEWFIEAIARYGCFKGRSSRRAFWMFCLYPVLILLIYAVVLFWLQFLYIFVSALTFDMPTEKARLTPMGMVAEVLLAAPLAVAIHAGLFCAALIVPFVAISVRRLHDHGFSGLWILFALVPVVGAIWFIIIMSIKGEEYDNRFGEKPQAVQQWRLMSRSFNIFRWYALSIRKFADFGGRAGRQEYWMFQTINILLLSFGIFLLFIFSSIDKQYFTILAVLVQVCGVLVTVPSISVSVRRLHDIGISGVWVSFFVIPFYGMFFLTVLMCMEGTPGPNQYGEARRWKNQPIPERSSKSES